MTFWNCVHSPIARRSGWRLRPASNELAASQEQMLVEQDELSLARTTLREALQLTEDAAVKEQIKARIASTRK